MNSSVNQSHTFIKLENIKDWLPHKRNSWVIKYTAKYAIFILTLFDKIIQREVIKQMLHPAFSSVLCRARGISVVPPPMYRYSEKYFCNATAV